MRYKVIPICLCVVLAILFCSQVFAGAETEYDFIVPDVPTDETLIEDDELNSSPNETLPTEPTVESTGSIVINKKLVASVWHTECDVMGDQYWVKDEISNPQGIKSKEGHRIDHCGAKDSWYVYLNEQGKPYAMLEMKAGSTNNLIPLPAIFYTDDTYTELRDPATIEPGERIYWTTENKGQCWHHTGVTRLDIPKFEFVVNGESYYLQPGESLELNLPAGEYTIVEKYDKEYIINDVNIPFKVDKDGSAVVSVNLNSNEKVEVDFENRPKNMPEPPPPPETEPVTEPVTETETETESEVQTETETETELDTETEEMTETEYEGTETETEETETESENITETESETEKITETETEKMTETEIETEEMTESESEEETESEVETESETEKPKKQTEKSTEKPTETPQDQGGVAGVNRGNEVTKKIVRKETVRVTEKVVEQVAPQKAPQTGDNSPIVWLAIIFGVTALFLLFQFWKLMK